MTKRDKEIIKYVNLADRWVRGFIRSKPEFAGDYDDLISVAKIKVIEAIDGPRKKNGHFESFLRIITLNAMTDYLRREYVRRPKFRKALSFSHLKDFRREGEEIPCKDDIPYEGYDPNGILEQHCQDRTDLMIVARRLDGLSKTSVARVLGLSRTTVNRRLKALEKRYHRATQ